MKRCSDYDAFAWLYNQEWGAFAENVFPLLKDVAKGSLSDEARVLDLCCGTGQLAKVLTEKGYKVTGIDSSKEMLRYAKKNAPDAKFILGDARNFRLPTVYDAVFSTFNALNHVMTLEELRQVFRNVIGCLVSGGIFIFDLNMEKEFETQWRTLNRTNERPDYTYSVRGDYNKKRQLAKLHCTICRRKAKSWKCSNITLLETCYSQAKVRSALKKAGFTNIRARTFDRQLRLDKAADAVNMMCFFAQKPRRPGDTRFCGRSVCPPAIL